MIFKSLDNMVLKVTGVYGNLQRVCQRRKETEQEYDLGKLQHLRPS